MTKHGPRSPMPASARSVAFVLLAVLTTTLASPCKAQNNDKQLRGKADALFENGKYFEALPLYSQLVSLSPADYDLNYKLGTCSIYGKDEKQKAIGFLKYAVQGPSTPALAWYFLGRAYQLDYRFDDAIEAYRHFSGTADNKLLGRYPVEGMQQQCRNAKQLLSNIKDITVLQKVEVADNDFFRFYDLGDIGGKIVVTPDELLSAYDRRSGERFITYIPNGGGPVYFSSYGKNGSTGRDIYRCELLPGGKFSAPVRLAGYINTDQDEAYAVMSQDRRSLYFCSKGHNSMGGYDVFKSAYDAGMDVFGAPENLDFAVNTPADELLYITDAEGKQACFASDRDSPQGRVNVYRVGTKQAPINITVMQGEFASAFSPADRKARIFVEDMLTHERVADVNTTETGGYLLAVPRGGQYQFKVETGTGVNKLMATVDVPNNDAPVAYRQEMRVTGPTGEKLEITTHFDAPLQGDVMALALEEIKRRARLDVTGERMQPLAATVPVNTGDPLAQAGFDGSVTLSDVKAMAKDEAAKRRAEAKEQSTQADRSYALALSSVELAEKSSNTAADLVSQAATSEDPVNAGRLLVKAAIAREEADDATLRAKSAYAAALVLDSAAHATTKEADRAATVANAVDQGIASGNNANLTDALKQLKAATDLRNGPTPRLSNAERLRREATEATATAAKKVQQAMAARQDESDFAQRVDSKHREADASKGGRKEDAERQLGDMKGALAALKDEADEAFEKARAVEEEASAARGTAALAKYLEENPEPPSASPAMEQIAGLASRINKVKQANAALSIPEEYEPVATETAAQRQQRLFDWGSASGSGGAVTAATGTRSGSTGSGSVTMAAGNKEGGSIGTKPGSTAGTELATVADGSGHLADTATSTVGNSARPETGNSIVEAGKTGTKAPITVEVADRVNVPEPATEGTEGQESGTSTTATVNFSEDGSTTNGNKDIGTAPVLDPDEQAFFTANALAESKQLRESAPDRRTRDSLDLVIKAQQEQLADLVNSVTKDVASTMAEPDGSKERSVDAAADDHGQDQRAADSTHAVIKTQQERLAALDTDVTKDVDGALAKADGSEGSGTNAAPTGQPRTEGGKDDLAVIPASVAEDNAARSTEAVVPEHEVSSTTRMKGTAAEPDVAYGMEYSELAFDPAILDADLLEELVPGFAWMYKAAQEGPGSAQEKAAAVGSLEQRLVDSIDTRVAAQTAYLKAHPGDSTNVVPQLERLRGLKAKGPVNAIANAGVPSQSVAEVAPLLLDTTDKAVPPVLVPETAMTVITPAPAVIAQAPEPEQAYEANVAFHSPEAQAGSAKIGSDLVVIQELRAIVDSMEKVISGTAPGAERDRLRSETDDKANELMGRQLYLGERLGRIAGTEFKAATDSSRTLDQALTSKAVPADAPLRRMAQDFELAAKAAMDKASGYREAAKATFVPTAKNSLYRQAWAEEVGAFRTMDRAHTVQNYLLRADALPMEALPYAEVERRSGAAEVPVLATNQPDKMKAPAPVPDPVVKAEVPVPVPTTAVKEDEDPIAQQAVVPVVPESVPATPEVVAAPEVAEAAHTPETISSDALASARKELSLPPFMDTYYKLDPAIKDRLSGDAEARVYFMLQGSARVQADSARTGTVAADDLAAQADGLRKEAANARRSSMVNGAVEADRLETRATALSGRSDSLRLKALGHSHESALDLAASEHLLSGLSVERSSDIASLEKQSRRQDLAVAGQKPSEPLVAVVQRPTEKIDAAAPSVIRRDTVTSSPAPVIDPDRSASSVGQEKEPDATAVDVAPPTVTEPVPDEVGPTTPERLPDTSVMPVLNADVFALKPTGAKRSTPIPVDAPMPQGVVYKVQVGAFRNALPLDAFGDMTPVTGESVGNGLTRYAAGMFTTAESAVKAGELVRARGYGDAFVVAYMNGKRVSLREAMAAEHRTPVAQGSGAPIAVPTAAKDTMATAVVPVANAPIDRGEGAELLVKYPSTVQEVLAGFKPNAAASDYYNDPGAAPAKQVETVRGLFFTVQVGVYSKPTALDRLFNITPLNSERTSTNKIRYTTGIFLDPNTADSRKDVTVGLGVKDAFVTAYLNGARIPLQEGKALLAKFGTAILVDPALGDR